MIVQNYAKQVAVDDAFRQLHEVAVEGKVVWNAEYECCYLHVLVDAGGQEGILRAFVIEDGLIEEQEGKTTFEEMVTMFSNARPRLTLVK
jgi:hypothetical protein